jgi:exopolysaccharide biosynthesis WecB/TagA/CpsF family protein
LPLYFAAQITHAGRRMNSPMPDSLTPPPAVLLGNVPLHPLRFAAALDLIAGWVGTTPFRLVVTPNVDHVINLQRNAEFLRVYREEAALSLADGVPILWAARYLGLPPLEKVSGSDLLPALCARGSSAGWRVFFAGAESPAELEQCLAAVRARYPGLVVAGASPPYGFERDPAASQRLLEAMRAFAPGIIFMGVGAPKSELWLARHRAALGTGVGLCIGAGLRMLAGFESRAPRWMQRLGLEWSWRLLRNPGRLWKRYLVDDVRFFPLVWRWKHHPPR